jgi:hypothetical protein
MATYDSFTRVPVGRKQVRFPVLSALPVAYWVTGDTGQKQTTEINWDNKYLNIEEIAAIVPIPENVVDDSDVPIWEQVHAAARAGRRPDARRRRVLRRQRAGSFPTNVVAAAPRREHVAIGTNNAAAGGIVGDQSDCSRQDRGRRLRPVSGVANRVAPRQGPPGAQHAGRAARRGRHHRDTVEIDGVTLHVPDARPVADRIRDGARRSCTTPPSSSSASARTSPSRCSTEAVIQDNTGAIVYNLAQQDMVALRLTCASAGRSPTRSTTTSPPRRAATRRASSTTPGPEDRRQGARAGLPRRRGRPDPEPSLHGRWGDVGQADAGDRREGRQGGQGGSE